jgi:hypothetical protein
MLECLCVCILGALVINDEQFSMVSSTKNKFIIRGWSRILWLYTHKCMLSRPEAYNMLQNLPIILFCTSFWIALLFPLEMPIILTLCLNDVMKFWTTPTFRQKLHPFLHEQHGMAGCLSFLLSVSQETNGKASYIVSVDLHVYNFSQSYIVLHVLLSHVCLFYWVLTVAEYPQLFSNYAQCSKARLFRILCQHIRRTPSAKAWWVVS